MSAGAFSVVIPARLASSRLPRKVLLPLGGKPVVQWVWEAAQRAGAAKVVVAVDSEEVGTVARGFGAEVVMTDTEHQSGTDRAAEVARALQWPADSIVVNVQGDEPLIPPALIGQCAAELASDAGADIATLAHPIGTQTDFANPNVVKVVMTAAQRALYFSRAPIPWWRDGSQPLAPALPIALEPLRHIGLYAYRVSALQRLAALPPVALEQTEALEQLRALHAGMQIRIGVSHAAPPHGVDTAADLAALQQRIGA